MAFAGRPTLAVEGGVDSRRDNEREGGLAGTWGVCGLRWAALRESLSARGRGRPGSRAEG